MTVTDDDTPEVSITAVTSPVTEGADALFTVSASTAPSSDLTVNVSVTDSGSFIRGTAPTTVMIPAGDTSALLTVSTEDDTMNEPSGTLTVEVTVNADYTVAAAPSNQAIVVVNDNDGMAEPSITITADNASVAEGTPATFTVTADVAPTSNLTVNVSVTQSGDFLSGTLPTTVMIPTTTTTATLTVSTVGDSTDELDGTVTATVTPGTGYMVGTPSSAEVAVTDDDAPVVSIIAAGASPVSEGTSALFEVIASTVQASDLEVNVSVDDGTADFIAGPAPTTVTIPSRQSRATLSVPTEDDGIDEANGTITATLTTGADYTVAAPPGNSAEVEVTDNDMAGITVTPTSGLMTTEVGGTATFTVVLDSQPTANVVIGVSSSDEGEGTVSTDMLTFTDSNWDDPQTVTVTGVDDSADDGTVDYTIELAAPTSSTDTNYSVVDPADVSVSNTDNDVAPTSITLTAQPSSLSEGDNATDVTVTATLNGSTVSTATIVTLSLGGSAMGSGTDYSATALTITIAAETATGTANFSITPTDDDVVEGDETIEVSGMATGGFAGTVNSAIVTLTDNDVADATPPTFVSASVTGDMLVLTYDEVLDTTSTPAVGAFTIGGPLVSVTTVAISGMTVTLTLSAAVASGDTVTVSYMPGTNPLRDAAMNNAVALTDATVTNNTADYEGAGVR